MILLPYDLGRSASAVGGALITAKLDTFEVRELGAEATEEALPVARGLDIWLSPVCFMKSDLKARTPRANVDGSSVRYAIESGSKAVAASNELRGVSGTERRGR